jgi:uncharacterized protein YjbI with pentapeptide repeats
MLQSMTHQLREKIQRHIKNGIDISELIKDVSIKGEDFGYAKISYFHRVGEDFSNTNFYNASIGSDDKISMILNCNIQHCNFQKVKFGKVFLRHSDARWASFREVIAPEVQYQFTDFRGCSFCHAVLKIGTEEGIGAKFDTAFFQDLTKGWGIEIEVKEKSSGPSNV